jgi:hypothetical protein
MSGKFEEIGRSVGALVDEKDRAYGSAFERMGRVLAELFPNGIRPEQYADLAGIIRVEDKLFRIATDKDAFGEDPWKDVSGYGILGTERRQRERLKPTISELEALLKSETASPASVVMDQTDFDPKSPLHVELVAAAACKPETEPERTTSVLESFRNGKPTSEAWARLERAARAFAGDALKRSEEMRSKETSGWAERCRRQRKELEAFRAERQLGDVLRLQASELREAMESAGAAERARCVAIARAEEARWREEGAKPVEQRSMYASTQAVMAAEATASRIAAAMKVETKESPAAYVALRSAQEVSEGNPAFLGGKKIGTVEREEHFAVPIEQVRQALAMVCDGGEYGFGWRHILDMAISELAKLRAKASPEPFGSVPMNVEMWCPFCGLQHVESGEWVTRVHHTHLCSGCRKKWRVAPAMFGVDAHRELIIGGSFPPALRGLVDLEHRQNAVVVNNQRRRTSEAEAKLAVASARAAEAVMRFSGVEEQVRFEVAAAVSQAINGALDATHQGALAKLQHDVQKADQRADKAAARATELERLLEQERRPVRCHLCEQAIAPGTMVSTTADSRVVHSTCPVRPQTSGAL